MSENDRHSAQCNVCKHDDLDEIEVMLRQGNSAGSVEREFGLSRDSAARHAKYYGIRLDEEAALRKLIGKGMDNLNTKAPSATNTIDAIKVLARMTGKLDNKREIMAVMFPGKTEDQVAHWANTGQWKVDTDGDIERVT